MQLSNIDNSASVSVYTQPSTELPGLNSTFANPPASDDEPAWNKTERLNRDHKK